MIEPKRCSYAHSLIGKMRIRHEPGSYLGGAKCFAAIAAGSLLPSRMFEGMAFGAV
jgi:hypothetical protein